MKKLMPVLLTLALVCFLDAADARGFHSHHEGVTPQVVYESPYNDSTVDLKGKQSISFKWQMVPIPSGGREVYRFTLYKGDGYDVVLNKIIDSRTFFIEVPANMFEEGTRYRWRVMQRDSRTMNWSHYDNWYFEVKK